MPLLTPLRDFSFLRRKLVAPLYKAANALQPDHQRPVLTSEIKRPTEVATSHPKVAEESANADSSPTIKPIQTFILKKKESFNSLVSEQFNYLNLIAPVSPSPCSFSHLSSSSSSLRAVPQGRSKMCTDTS